MGIGCEWEGEKDLIDISNLEYMRDVSCIC